MEDSGLACPNGKGKPGELEGSVMTRYTAKMAKPAQQDRVMAKSPVSLAFP